LSCGHKCSRIKPYSCIVRVSKVSNQGLYQCPTSIAATVIGTNIDPLDFSKTGTNCPRTGTANHIDAIACQEQASVWQHELLNISHILFNNVCGCHLNCNTPYHLTLTITDGCSTRYCEGSLTERLFFALRNCADCE